MRKLLALLGSLGLVATASSAVISCGLNDTQKLNKEYTGSKNTIDKIETAKKIDNGNYSITIDLTIPKNTILVPYTNGKIGINGEIINTKGNTKILNFLKVVKFDKQKVGTSITDEEKDSIDAHIYVSSKNVQELLKNSRKPYKDELPETAYKILQKKTKIEVNVEIPPEYFENNDELKMGFVILRNVYGENWNPVSSEVIADLYNLTIKK